MKPLDVGLFQALCGAGANSCGEVSSAGLPVAGQRFAKALRGALEHVGTVPPSLAFDRHSKPQPAADEGRLSDVATSEDGGMQVRISCDRACVFAFCDLLLGGTGDEQAFTEDRPLSRIERAIAARLMGWITEQLGTLLPDLSQQSFAIKAAGPGGEERAGITPAVTLHFIITVMGYSGEISLDLDEAMAALCKAQPPAKVEEALLVPKSNRVAIEVNALEVEIEAVYPVITLPLHRLMALVPGAKLPLVLTLATPARLISDGVMLGEAQIGQTEGHFCLKLL